MFKRIASSLLVLALLIGPNLSAQGNHTQEVAFVKSVLMAQNVNLQGACGAFQITGRVAFKLKDQGYKLLRKQGGNRAIILPDGSCVDGDHGSGPGYATDYLISASEGFVGFDLLGDGGGMNAPQWIGPESDAEMVKRNLANFAEPFALGGDVVVPTPTPTPTPTPVPTPTPAPAPGVDYSPLLQEILNSQQLQIRIIEEIQRISADTNVRVTNMDRTLTQTLGSISKFIGKYIAPAIGGYLIAHQLNNPPPAAQ